MAGDRRNGGDRRSCPPLKWRDHLGGVSRLGAYVLVVVVFAFTVRADRYQSFHLCERARAQTIVLRTLVNRSTSLEAPPGSDPQLVEILERSREEGEAFRVEANRILVVEKCHRPWP